MGSTCWVLGAGSMDVSLGLGAAALMVGWGFFPPGRESTGEKLSDVRRCHSATPWWPRQEAR